MKMSMWRFGQSQRALVTRRLCLSISGAVAESHLSGTCHTHCRYWQGARHPVKWADAGRFFRPWSPPGRTFCHSPGPEFQALVTRRRLGDQTGRCTRRWGYFSNGSRLNRSARCTPRLITSERDQGQRERGSLLPSVVTHAGSVTLPV